MVVKGIIFDLDGTLLDTLDDLADAVNHTLQRLGMPTHPVQAYCHMVGDGPRVLLAKALGDDRHPQLQRAMELFLDRYQANALVKTRLYAGVDGMLDAATQRGVPLAIHTNKPHDAAVYVVEARLSAWRWLAVEGLRPDTPKKPDPAVPIEIAQRMGILPEHCIFVGDSDTDMHTARNAGMVGIGAGWGFRGAEELSAAGAAKVLQRPGDLLTIL